MTLQPERPGGYRILALALATVLATAAHAEAQTAASFDELPRVLSLGDRVTVTDDTGRDLTGPIIDLSPSGLALSLRDLGGARIDLPAAEVSRVRQWRSDSLRNGTLIGLGVAAVPGFLFVVAAGEGASAYSVVGFMGLSLGLGAGMGAGIDALIPTTHVLYDRTSAARQRWTVSPTLSAHRRGVAVSVGF